MIEAVKAWVRDLVILVIFSSLIEMLLPSGSLKKYVKVVLGFFIMLAVLNPLLSILRADYRAFYPFQTIAHRKEQQEIKISGEKMQNENQQLALAAFQAQLEQQMRAVILTQGEVEDAIVQVTANAEGQIETVRIRLTLISENQPSTPTSGVQKIEKVNIAINKDNQSVKSGVSSDSLKVQRIQEKVKKLMISFYNLKPEVISFQ